jgi:cell division septation protein DedD
MTSPLFGQSVTAGIDAWRKQDYAGAVAIWRPLAEKGDADAAFNLGQAYRMGRGVTLNLSAAQTWFERAAREGHIDAQTTLGLLLFQNGNQTAGLRWLKGAADKGDARAMLIYGTALFNGDGIAQDPVLGYAYVSRAAAQGLAPAKQTLEQMDQVLPLADRKRGVAIAIAKAKAAPPPSSSAKKVAKVAAAKSRVKPAAPAPAAPKPSIKAAEPTAPASGSWRIQLGAFNNRAAAEGAYRKLAGNAALAGRSPQYLPFGQFIRLRVGPFPSRDSAAAACSAVKVACFTVAPGK